MGSIFLPTRLASISGELPRLINFILFVLVLYFLLRKPVTKYFQDRAQAIQRDLEEARTEREKAREQLKGIESRLSRLDEEVNELKAKASTEADAEKVRIAASAESDAERLRAMARREIEGAMNAARIELKAFAARQATELAESIVRREITDQDHHRLIERFNQQIREVRR